MEPMENDDLSLYLTALARDDSFRVEETLKEGPRETTEVVYFTGAQGGELGPFIRKRIQRGCGIGEAYDSLCTAQRQGKRFRHLPRVYDVHERDETLIVIMEYIAGHTLQEEVYRRDASIDLARTLFPALCDGVAELHEGFAPPLIHRDLKPSNIIICNGNLTIIDFGIARTYRDGAQGDTTPFGTRAYAPPEQFGFRQTDEQSDVYALGMILYYLLTEKTPEASAAQQGFPDLAFARRLQAVVAKATAFDPLARYRSAAELKQAFLEAAEADIQAAEATAATRAAEPPAAPLGNPRTPTSPSEILGLFWDTIVLLAWVICIGGCISSLISPGESVRDYPFWLRFLIYPLDMGLFFTAVGYGLLDKRWLRRRIPLLRNQTFGRALKGSLVAIAISLVLLIMLAFTAILVTT